MNRRRFVTQSLAGVALSRSLLRPSGSEPLALESPLGPGRIVSVEAKPAAINLDLGRTAVLVIDMTNDFGSKGGMFDLAGIDISIIRRAVAPTARVLSAARKNGLKIIYLKMAYRPDRSDMGLPDSPNWRDHDRFGVGKTVHTPNGAESRVCIRNTWNTRVIDELKPEGGDIEIYKMRFSGFYGTELDDMLKRLGARYLIVTGCTTSICVESTIRDATFRDYSPVLLADCSAEPIGHEFARSNHDASLLLIETLLGWVSNSETFVKSLGTGA